MVPIPSEAQTPLFFNQKKKEEEEKSVSQPLFSCITRVSAHQPL